MTSYEQLQADYADAYPDYERLASQLELILRQRLDAAGLRRVEVSARAKDPGSFIKKALRKGYDDPMVAIGDKAGVRLVTPFSRDRPRLVEICEQALVLSNPQDKRELLGSERVGYLAHHYVAQLRPDALAADQRDLVHLSAELQIHTKAENAWATAAHDSLYKAVVEVPDSVARRLQRLGALAEIFDDQVEQFLVEVSALPDFAVLDAILPGLDALLLRLTPSPGDQGVSALLVPALAGLYDVPAEVIVPDRIQPYFDRSEIELRQLYERHEGDARANPLLYQPEALMLFERLATDPYTLRAAWPSAVEIELLERLAVLRGARLA
jgi:ppGpp synthetase/RelA/SpoT-type nucleotidyltranferase